MPAVRPTPGPQGPAGPAGAPGFPQPREFPQAAPASVWAVSHGFGRFPVVNVIDSAGTQVLGQVHHQDENNLTISFSSPFSGRVLVS
jgi:hypothetical protein